MVMLLLLLLLLLVVVLQWRRRLKVVVLKGRGLRVNGGPRVVARRRVRLKVVP